MAKKNHSIESRFEYSDWVPLLGGVTCGLRIMRRGATLHHMLDEGEITHNEFSSERKKDFVYDMGNLVLNAAYIFGLYYLSR